MNGAAKPADDGLPEGDLRTLSRDALVRRVVSLREDLITVTHERDQANAKLPGCAHSELRWTDDSITGVPGAVRVTCLGCGWARTATRVS